MLGYDASTLFVNNKLIRASNPTYNLGIFYNYLFLFLSSASLRFFFSISGLRNEAQHNLESSTKEFKQIQYFPLNQIIRFNQNPDVGLRRFYTLRQQQI